jgi:DNA-binding transcriptional ArsR family regulator
MYFMIVFNSIYIEILYGKTFYIRERVTLKMDIDQIVKVHKALGDSTRYKIIQIIDKENSLCPAQLEGRLDGIPLSTLSHHLKQLSDCGILNSEKQGTYIYYSLNEDIAKKFVPDLYDISIKPGKPKS